jgi:hypothetical protein
MAEKQSEAVSSEAGDTGAERATAFLFQSNPDRWDMRSFLKPGEEVAWYVTRYPSQMRPGALVLLWEARGREQVAVRGLYGWGITTDEVGPDEKGDLRIPVHCVERWVHPDDDESNVPDDQHIAPIPGSEVLDLPSWSGHQLATMPIGTNFLVSREQLGQLSELVVKPAVPDSQFPQAVDQVTKGEGLDPGLFKPVRLRVGPPRPSVKGRMVDDTPATSDILGFAPLVQGLDDLLNHSETKLPLAITVTAPWGGGKSSVMLQLEQSLRKTADRGAHAARYRRRWHTVRLGAWKYEKSERLWAALAKAIYEQPQKRMSGLEALRFRLLLQWRRLGRWRFLARSVPLAVIVLGALVTLALGIAGEVGERAGNGTLSLAGLTTSVVVLAALGRFWGVVGDPFKRGIQAYVARPRWEEQLGFTKEADNDIYWLMETLTPSEEDAVAVFVDDLDRCSGRHVIEVVEAINQIFNSTSEGQRRCVFILGMDREVVAASIEVAHGETVAQLERRGSSIAEDYGSRFLAKIAQLSVTIPPARPDAMLALLDAITGEERAAPGEDEGPREEDIAGFTAQIEQRFPDNLSEVRRARQEIEATHPNLDDGLRRALDNAELEVGAQFDPIDSPDVRDAERLLLKRLEWNPRQVKRFDNAFRLQIYVASHTSERSLHFSREELVALAKWIALRIRWPRLAEDMDRERGPDPERNLLKALEDSANGREVRLDQALKDHYQRWFEEAQVKEILQIEPEKRIATLRWDSFVCVA